jgi:hydroxyquinol 1,2-dioxygenase
VIDTDDGGERLRLRGTVHSLDGRPLAGALVDVWSCASNGLYPAQDPAQAPTNLRGLFRTDARGRYELITLRPTNYSVPTDGPVGELLRLNARSPMRAAHIHLIASAAGYQTVVTHLFDSASPHIQADAVFSVRPSLVRNLEKVKEGYWAAEFDIALAPEDRP